MGSCPDPEYTWGAQSCSCGAQIMDWTRCQQAAAFFGVRYIGCGKPAGCIGRHQHKEPKGCIWRKDGDILFNGLDGRRHKIGERERALVCADATFWPLFRLGGSDNECPAHYAPETSLADCQKAAQSFGIPWNSKSPFEYIKEPSGCVHRINDGDMIFNTHPNGMTHKIGEGERERVCALT